MAETVFSYGRGGNGVAGLKSGWSKPEDAFTWSIGRESVLEIPLPQTEGGIDLELYLLAFAKSPSDFHQRVQVEINGTPGVMEHLGAEGVIGYTLPCTDRRSDTTLHVKLSHPDAVSPKSLGISSDTRELAIALSKARLFVVPEDRPFAPLLRKPLPIDSYPLSVAGDDKVRGVTALTLPDLALSFESLALNCEFGLFQRRCGVEPLGLLRFASLTYLNLIRGIDARFDGLSDLASLVAFVQDGWNEWTVQSDKFHLLYNTLRPSTMNRDALLDEQSRVLAFKREKFLEIAETGEKIFVINRPEGISAAQAMPLCMSLRRVGPAALLFVSSTTGKPAGTVEAVAPYLFCGSMDGVERILPPELVPPGGNWLSDAAMVAWISICANTYRLWRENRPF